MKVISTSHIAIGVRDMERSLEFYRDVLGLRVTLDDPAEDPGGAISQAGVPGQSSRHGVYLRWEDGPASTFIVLSQYEPVTGKPLRLNEVGIHHVSFWVSDLEETFARVQASGARIVRGPVLSDTIEYGEAPGGKVLTTLFKDPDGVIIQLDQRM